MKKKSVFYTINIIILIFSLTLIVISSKMIKSNLIFKKEWGSIRKNVRTVHYMLLDKMDHHEYYGIVLNKETYLFNLKVWHPNGNTEKVIFNLRFSGNRLIEYDVYSEGSLSYLLYSSYMIPEDSSRIHIPLDIIYTEYIYNPLIPLAFIVITIVMIAFSSIYTVYFVKNSKETKSKEKFYEEITK